MMTNVTFQTFWPDSSNASDDYYQNRLLNDSELVAINDYQLEEFINLRSLLYQTVVPIMILFCLIAVVTNLSILMSVRWIRRTLSPTLCFSISLAVADAYASLIVGIGLIVNSLLPIVFNIQLKSMCFVLILEGFRTGGLIVSVLHLLLLAVNHYIGIIRPLHYASTMTKRKALLNIALMWILPIVFFFIYFASIKDQGFWSRHCEGTRFIVEREFRYITGGLFFIPLILMFFMYVHIFIIVIRHNRGLSQYQGSRHFKHNVKAATTTLLILGTYTIGWMPAVLFYIVTCLDCAVNLNELNPTVLLTVSMINNTLIILKLTVNPILYAARMKEISGAMKRMVSFCMPVFGSNLGMGGTGGGTTDELSQSSFIRSRNDTLYTTIRMQSVACGRNSKNTRKDEPLPILVYQKYDQNNSLSSTNCIKHKPTNNGVEKSHVIKSSSNGVKSNATSPTSNNEAV
ncbi:hypothetical protein CHUAL_006614 [Chamberlinius hualienensis]